MAPSTGASSVRIVCPEKAVCNGAMAAAFKRCSEEVLFHKQIKKSIKKLIHIGFWTSIIIVSKIE